ncbi:hypothetical protein HZH66_008824 [Vespula vulgaris]|uniref:Uncharacterized protein n=1 Tax=Vespula vulgaris TaxID=7454 RepID=A0A834JR48_VESVU|nr:hypothetical protein HZH66_008824 [Vespula vulgaris]
MEKASIMIHIARREEKSSLQPVTRNSSKPFYLSERDLKEDAAFGTYTREKERASERLVCTYYLDALDVAAASSSATATAVAVAVAVAAVAVP